MMFYKTCAIYQTDITVGTPPLSWFTIVHGVVEQKQVLSFVRYFLEIFVHLFVIVGCKLTDLNVVELFRDVLFHGPFLLHGINLGDLCIIYHMIIPANHLRIMENVGWIWCIGRVLHTQFSGIVWNTFYVFRWYIMSYNIKLVMR